MIALGAGVKLDERGMRMDTRDTHVAFELVASSKEPWDVHAQEYLNADGLMGMLFFFEPTERGHWTAMRVETQGDAKFTYSDSLRPGDDPEVTNAALTKYLTAPGMVEYLNNNEETTYGGNKWNTAIMVFQTVEQRNDFKAQITAWRTGKPKRKTVDLTGSSDKPKRKRQTVPGSSDKPKKKSKNTLHKEELIKEYTAIVNNLTGESISYDKMTEEDKEFFWNNVQKLFQKYARKSMKKHPDRFKVLPDFNKVLNLDQKKWVLRTFVALKKDASKK